MRWTFGVVFAWIMAVLLFFVGTPSRAQTPAEGVRQLYEQAKPFLQEALERKVPEDVQLKIVKTKVLRSIPSWNVKTFLSWRFPGMKKDQWQQVYRRCHDLYCQQVVARHLEGTHSVVVIPDHLQPLAASDPTLREVYSLPFLQLAIVHEVAKLALEEEHKLLSRRHDPHSLEDVRIQRALVEGRAQWITEQVARRIKTESYFGLLKQVWDVAAKVDAPENGSHDAWQATVQMQRDSYGKGLAFFRALSEKRSTMSEAQIFRNPPRRWKWIEAPQQYLKVLSQGKLQLRKVIGRLEKESILKGWTTRQQAWTPDLLTHVGQLLGAEKEAAEIAKKWVDGHSLVWMQKENPTATISLNLTRYDGEESAKAYIGFALDIQQKRDEYIAKAFGSSSGAGKSQVRYVKLHGLKNVIQITTTFKTSSKQTSMGMVLARKGALVLELHFRGVPTDIGWAASAIQATLRVISDELRTPPG
ncbi:MAG: hypothetical protein ACFCD0_09160 [Gemmataceae bacterium]